MMHTQIFVGSSLIRAARVSASGCGCTGSQLLYLNNSSPCVTSTPYLSWNYRFCHRWKPLTVSSSSYWSAAADPMQDEQNHYSVLRLHPYATQGDIKRAYRLLAGKYHPDVCKDPKAAEIFKSIRQAYEVLSNETRRYQYDRRLKFQEDNSRFYGAEWNHNAGFDDGLRFEWGELREKMRGGRHWKNDSTDEGSYNTEEDERDAQESITRGPFIGVLRSALLSVFLFRTLGPKISLTVSCLVALYDRKLDAGYKIGYLIACILGGRGGVLLTLFLSFASWLFGKTSSGMVAMWVAAIWILLF